ncbi:MAG: D-tyrosyl-tRNA(Tyr) deacylase [Bacteroidetes bacterium]|nr:D-tyrosyl-tRNA(Tyr) deacylase [Bacteroidota bacterium]
MRAVIQRVSSASVCINGLKTAEIALGFLVLLGIAEADTISDAEWLAVKVSGLRVFSDTEGHMNLGLAAVEGQVLVVSQFTLLADYKKGNRPSFIRAARPEVAIPLYEHFLKSLKALTGKEPQTGSFGADMQVALVNDGPVTICMDSQTKS